MNRKIMQGGVNDPETSRKNFQRRHFSDVRLSESTKKEGGEDQEQNASILIDESTWGN